MPTIEYMGSSSLRLSIPEAGRRLLPLPIATWHATVGARALDETAKREKRKKHHRDRGRR